MASATTKQKIKDLTKKMEQLKTQMEKECSALLKESTKEWFEKYPNVKSFTFHGWVPGFNDGDPCTYGFSAEDCHLYLNDYSLEEYPYFSYQKVWEGDEDQIATAKEELGEDWKTVLNEGVKELQSLLYAVPEEIYEQVYGSNHRTTFYSNGEVDNEYYDCGY